VTAGVRGMTATESAETLTMYQLGRLFRPYHRPANRFEAPTVFLN
jgi:hypothetical protein